MLILTDLDDVVFDWLGAFRKFLTAKGIETKTPRPVEYDLSKWLVKEKRVRKLIQEFNASPEFSQLEPLPSTREVIPALSAAGHRFVAITSCGPSEQHRMDRLNNLNTYFPDMFETVHVVDLGQTKEEILSWYTRTWWIEDKFENAVHGAEADHRALLLNRPHNEGQNHPLVVRVNNWHTIKKLILENTNGTRKDNLLREYQTETSDRHRAQTEGRNLIPHQ